MTAREQDCNGWPEIKRNPLSKVGVFPYMGKSVDPSFAPDQIVMVYRPEEELASIDTIESFKLIPWTDDHPSKLLGPEEVGRTPAEQKGVHGVIGEDVVYEDGTLYGNIKVFSDALAGLIDSGKRELSVGYGCRYELSSGIWNGQRYDAIQRTIRGNHLATVAEGRMGPDVAVLDHLKFTFDAKDFKMADTEEKSGEQKGPTMDDVMSSLKQLGKDYASVKGVIDKHFGKDDEEEKAMDGDDDEKKDKKADDKACDEDEEKKKDEKKGEDKGMDRAAMDSAVNAALKPLQAEIETLKKGGVKALLGEISRRDALAAKLSGFVGSFDHAEMTLAEVAEYGVEKLKVPCAKGTEAIALDAYLFNRSVPTNEVGFALDAFNGSSGKSDVADFYAKSA